MRWCYAFNVCYRIGAKNIRDKKIDEVSKMKLARAALDLSQQQRIRDEIKELDCLFGLDIV